MINNLIKIKKKIFKSKNFFNLIIKIGKQQHKFLKNKYLLTNCIVNTWIKIVYYENKIFIFGYSNSLLLSGLIKFFFKIINNKKKKNILIFLKFDFFLLLKIKKRITNFKYESIINILFFLYNTLNYNL